MKRAVLAILICVMVWASIVAAKDEKSLIADHCLGCHEMDKICSVPAEADDQWWQETVERMFSYKPDMMTERQAMDAISILSDPQRKAKVCK